MLNAPGSATGYSSLASLFLHPDQPKERVDPKKLETLIQPFVLRWKALSEKPAIVSVTIGATYKNRGLFEAARRHLRDALELDPSSAASYVWLGYTDLGEAGQAATGSPTPTALYDSARANFEIAIRLMPAALDGYWALGWLYMQQQNWVEAEAWTDRCLRLQPEWESFVLVRRAEIFRQQGRFKEAEEDLLRSLAIESVNQPAWDVMSSLMDDYHAKGENDAARLLLEKCVQLSRPASAYLDYNRLGNWSYEAGDYASAVELYRQAIKIKDADAVLHSNLAGAIQKLRVAGQRCQELQEAVTELERARELAPATDLAEKIAALRLELAFLQSYGEAAAALEPVVDAIRVDIDWAVMPEMLALPESKLSEGTIAGVQAIRTRLQEKFGFVLPGVSFRDIQPPGSGKYRITFNESTTYEGWVTAGSVSTTVFAHLEQVVENHMAELLSREGVTWLLNQSNAPAAQAIIQDTRQLTRFVGHLRRVLKLHQQIEPIGAIGEAFLQSDKTNESGPPSTPSGGTPDSASDGFPSLVLKMSAFYEPNQTTAETDLFRTDLFNELGIAIPLIDCQLDASLRGTSAVLLLNGRTVSNLAKLDPEIVGGSLRSCASDLMVPALTEYYLTKLNARYPTLSKGVRTELNIPGITADLKQRLSKGSSIKNLPEVLEEQLQSLESTG